MGTKMEQVKTEMNNVKVRGDRASRGGEPWWKRVGGEEG